MKTTFLLSAALAVGITVAPQLAVADIITTYDTNAAGGNGVYNGTGGVDGDFTTTTADYGADGTISLSLRGAQRTIGPITPTANNNYACSGTEQCNFDWSVGTTGTGIGSYSYDLTVTDLTSGKSFDFASGGLADPSGGILGDSYWDGGKTTTYDVNATGFQNSEYLGFSFLGLGWNPNDQVVATLTATPDISSLPSASVTIGFNNSPSQVPEPTSIALAFTVLAFCWTGLKRRRQA